FYLYFFCYPFAFPILLLLFFLPSISTPLFSSLSLHDALPIYIFFDVAGCISRPPGPFILVQHKIVRRHHVQLLRELLYPVIHIVDRKSTRLNSSHVKISYAVFCLKKKKKKKDNINHSKNFMYI